MPERDIGSLGAMGKGAGGGQEILPPPSSAPSPSHFLCLQHKSSYIVFLENKRSLFSRSNGNLKNYSTTFILFCPLGVSCLGFVTLHILV